MSRFESPIHDVVIIGAGPSSLALAARLREPKPCPLFTTVEHRLYPWIRRHEERFRILKTKGRAQKMVIEESLPCMDCVASLDKPRYRIQVLDSSAGSWMGRWRGLFEAYDIRHLRSPLFFHTDPSNRDGLKAFAYSTGRVREINRLKGVCGKEMSKHQKKKMRKGGCGCQSEKPVDERDMQDYFTPSTCLFNDYCQDCVGRYNLDTVVQHCDVQSITFEELGENGLPDRCFTIQTSQGVQYSRTVVMAIGPGTPSPIPISTSEADGACHSSQLLNRHVLNAHLQQKLADRRPVNAVVIGGGLTSAQLTDLCIKNGISKVYHLMRDIFKTKYFDCELSWAAKYKNFNMTTFWSADTDEERYEILQAARGGGSITPAYRSVLQGHITQGRLSLHTNTVVASKVWDTDTKTWSIVTDPPIVDLPPIDFIYYATGSTADVNTVPLLQKIREKYPIESINGLPCLTHDLQWNDDVPLFVTGRYAGLRLGPWAANLEGARNGAERIAWRMEELFQKERGSEDEFQ